MTNPNALSTALKSYKHERGLRDADLANVLNLSCRESVTKKLNKPIKDWAVTELIQVCKAVNMPITEAIEICERNI